MTNIRENLANTYNLIMKIFTLHQLFTITTPEGKFIKDLSSHHECRVSMKFSGYAVDVQGFLASICANLSTSLLTN